MWNKFVEYCEQCFYPLKNCIVFKMHFRICIIRFANCLLSELLVNRKSAYKDYMNLVTNKSSN